MDELKYLVKEYGERYSTATIYIVFVIFSLIVAAVLFGILQSTGVMKVVFSGYVEEATFGGAFAGFLVTLIFLVRSYDQAQKTAKLQLKGNVFLPNRSPVKGAVVFVEGDKHAEETNAIGAFVIEVNEQKSWVVRALWEEGNAEATVSRKDIAQPIPLIIEQRKNLVGDAIKNLCIELDEIFRVIQLLDKGFIDLVTGFQNRETISNKASLQEHCNATGEYLFAKNLLPILQRSRGNLAETIQKPAVTMRVPTEKLTTLVTELDQYLTAIGEEALTGVEKENLEKLRAISWGSIERASDNMINAAAVTEIREMAEQVHLNHSFSLSNSIFEHIGNVRSLAGCV